jgi:hypothetical protein
LLRLYFENVSAQIINQRSATCNGKNELNRRNIL